MSWWRGRRPGRLLAGLLVLGVVLMSVTQVNALTVPGVTASAVAPNAPRQHDASTAAERHDRAEIPCKGHERSHGVACCLTSACPLLVVALPTTARMQMPVVPVLGTNSRLVATQPDGIGRTPEPPPPRSIV